MIKLMMRELEETLSSLRTSLADKMALQNKAVVDQKALETSVQKWTLRSQVAVEQGRDDLAREALIEKKKTSDNLIAADKNWEHLEKIILDTKSNISLLEEKLQEVIRRHKVLIQRANHARETIKVNKVVQQKADGTDALIRFGEMESRIERMEIEAEITGAGSSELEREFAKLESGSDVDLELEELKKNLKRGETK